RPTSLYAGQWANGARLGAGLRARSRPTRRPRRGSRASRQSRAAPSRRGNIAALKLLLQRVGATEPARHAERPEGIACRSEERAGAIPVGCFAAAHFHPSLVQVRDSAKRTCCLFLEDTSRLVEPGASFVEAVSEPAEACQRKAAVRVGVTEVR